MMHSLPEGWKEKSDSLIRIFLFESFPETLAFMVRVGFECEKMNHHPEWKNIYNSLEVRLSTHEAGNTVTEKDITLANKMNQIYDNRA